jgi:hypothetical protein
MLNYIHSAEKIKVVVDALLCGSYESNLLQVLAFRLFLTDESY